MDFDITRPGLYYLLNTPAVQTRIRELGIASRVCFEKGEPDEIIRLVSQAVAEVVQQELSTQLERLESVDSEALKRPEWIEEIVKGMLSGNAIQTGSEQRMPISDKVLTEVKIDENAANTPRPNTELVRSALIVPDGKSPQLGNEISLELRSSDRVEWLVSFIKLSAINAFYPQLRDFCNTPSPDGSPRLRIATTTYIGATEPGALKKLFSLPNTEIKVCFNSSQTRLHAKAYLFHRESGFGSAYIGSANLSSAALSSGMEWTVKVSQRELPYLWERSKIAFEGCWNDPNFETCTIDDMPRIEAALNAARIVQQPATPVATDEADILSLFTWTPHAYQRTMLDRMEAERAEGRHRHLVVSATGTGKTLVAVFDFQRLSRKEGYPSLLYIAHRKDILHSAAVKYRAVLGDKQFGWVPTDGIEMTKENVRQTFCTIQTWRSRIKGHSEIEKFDLIVLDECHHSEAAGYQELLDYYCEDIDSGRTDIVGLTATPFRSDGQDIRESFGGSFTHELSLPEAIEYGHIVPFDYFGIDDDSDFSDVNWGISEEHDIEEAILSNGKHLENVFRTLFEHVEGKRNLRAIGFCAGVRHATAAADYFQSHGVPSVVLTGNSTQEQREDAMNALSAIPPKINLIFTADLFNEGVDIPAVNTVMMLRPTNSPLVFLQQLGRGLRQAPCQYGKDALLVLDFVGNHNAKFKGYLRFKYLTSRPEVPLGDQIKAGLPFLPPGCSVTLSEIARKRVLDNIKANLDALRGTSLRRHLVEAIRAAHAHISLTGLMRHIQADSPAPIYNVAAPFELEKEALKNVFVAEPNIQSERFHVLAQNDSHVLLENWQKLLAGQPTGLSPIDDRLAKFFLLSAFDTKIRIDGTDLGWQTLLGQRGFVRDLREFIDWRLGTVAPANPVVFKEKTSSLLELHRTYSSQQISAALGQTGGVIMAGTFFSGKRNTDAFFITKSKSDAALSRFRDYNDYAETERVFHWSGPHATGELSAAGRRWIQDASTKMLFLRRLKKSRLDVTGNYPIQAAASYVFLGPVSRTLDHHEENGVLKFRFLLQHSLPAEIYDYAKEA